MFRKLKLESLDIYRDGGSLSVTYRDNHRILNVLTFPVQLRLNSDYTKPLYSEPKLEKHFEKKTVSPVTGLSRYESETHELNLSWKEARSILLKLASQVSAIDSQYKWIFDEMCLIANSEGLAGSKDLAKLTDIN